MLSISFTDAHSMPGTVLGSRNTPVKKIRHGFCLHGAYIVKGEISNKQVKSYMYLGNLIEVKVEASTPVRKLLQLSKWEVQDDLD